MFTLLQENMLKRCPFPRYSVNCDSGTSAAPLDVVKLPEEGFSEHQGHCSLNLDRLSPAGRLCKQHMSSSFGQKHVLWCSRDRHLQDNLCVLFSRDECSRGRRNMFYERKYVNGEERGLGVPDSPQWPPLLFYEHFQTQLLCCQREKKKKIFLYPHSNK